jgi:DNA-binding LytR/AlgR family response regulator
MGDMEAKIDELLMRARALDPPVKRIGVQEGDSIYLLPVEDICFVTTRKEGGLSYYAADGKIYVNFDGLTEMAKKLADDPKFMKVHKSYLVNLLQVTTITTVPGGRELKCQGWPGEAVKVAQDYVKAFEAYFKIG